MEEEKQEEYKDAFGSKSYMESVLCERKELRIQLQIKKEQEWRTTENMRTFKEKNGLFFSTVFTAKIPEKATTRQVWDWVISKGRINHKLVRGIILPKKRDKNNNRFVFIEIKWTKEADN